MATLGSALAISAGTHIYLHKLSIVVLGQDPIANTTRIQYTHTVTNRGAVSLGAHTAVGAAEITNVINGVTHTTYPNFDFRVSTEIVMQTGEQTITHDADGTKTIALSVQDGSLAGDTYYTLANSGTKYMTLPPFTQASVFVINPPSVVAGSSVSIDITRKNVAYTHTVTWASDVSTGTIATGVGTQTTYTPNGALLAGAEEVGIQVSVTTFSGATQIGDPFVQDMILRAVPTYPERGVGTPVSVRYRRMEIVGGAMVPVVGGPIPYLNTTFTDTLSTAPTCEITVSDLVYADSLDEAVVLLDIFDGSQWVDTGIVLFLSRSQSDQADTTGTSSYSGLGYVDYLLSKTILQSGRKGTSRVYTNLTPGAIMAGMLTESHSRGWGVRVASSFSSSKTSAKTAWANSTTLNTDRFTPISQILDGFVSDSLCEYRSRYSTGNVVLDIYNPGYGKDWTQKDSYPMVDLGLAALNKVADAAPVRKDFSEKLTRVFVDGSEAFAQRENASIVNPLFGHLEGSIAATGVTKPSTLNSLGDAALKQYKTPTVEKSWSYDMSSTQTPAQLIPYRIFRPGDWVFQPGVAGPERARVSQVAISVADDGVCTATITIGDLIPNGLVAIARKINRRSGNAVSGGTLLPPLPGSTATPAAPTNVVII